MRELLFILSKINIQEASMSIPPVRGILMVIMPESCSIKANQA